MNDQEFIKSLSKNHSQIRSLPYANKRAVLFGILSFIFLLSVVYFLGGLRNLADDYGLNLQTLELLTSLTAFFSVLMISFNSTIPGNSVNTAMKVFYFSSFIFVSSLIIRLFFLPTGYAPMVHRVFHCYKEVLFYAAGIQMFLYWRISKGVITNMKVTVTYTTLAAAILPLMLMSLGCCITPVHIIESHFIPLAIYTLVMAMAQYHFLRKNYEY